MAPPEQTQPPMKDSERFEACMKQAEYFARRCDDRRSYQWKVTLGFWTALLLAIGKLWGTSTRIPGCLLLAAFGGYLIWVHYVYGRNKDDGAKSRYFATQAENILVTPSTRIEPSPGS